MRLTAFKRLSYLFSAFLFIASCSDDGVLELAGTVERTAYELAAPASEVIVKIPVRLGERVNAGDVVVQLDTTVAQAELEASEAGLAAAEATLRAVTNEFERMQNLARKKVASANQLDKALQAQDEALAAVAEKKARIAQALKRLDNLTIQSNSGGILDQQPFEVGERVPPGAVVAVVQSVERPWVRVWVPARVVAKLSLNSRVTVRVQGIDGSLTGVLAYIAREPEYTPHYALTEKESAHLVFRAKVLLEDAPTDLRPGLAAQVSIALPAK